jgi:hypothetical protein
VGVVWVWVWVYMNAGGKRAVRGWRVLSNGHASAQLECHTCPHKGMQKQKVETLKKNEILSAGGAAEEEVWRGGGGGDEEEEEEERRRRRRRRVREGLADCVL